MNVGDIMVKRVTVCRAEDNLAGVAGAMWNHRCGVLPVLDDHGYVVSMITDRDICIALGTRNVRASDLRVMDVSLPRVFTCGPEDDILLVLTTMISQNVRRLPVVDRTGKLAGIISIDDFVWHAQKHPGKSGIPYEMVMKALKSLLESRMHGRKASPVELAAARA